MSHDFKHNKDTRNKQPIEQVVVEPAVVETVTEEKETVTTPATTVAVVQLEDIPPDNYTLSTLMDYAKTVVVGKPITVKDAVANNQSLLALFKVILSQSQEEFNKDWNTVLSVFNKYKTETFNERMLFRYSEYWTDGQKNYNLYRVLVTLAINTANPDTRRLYLNSINLEKFNLSLSPSQMQKIIAFYA